MRQPTIDDIEAASRRLAPHIDPTPLMRHPSLDRLTGGRVLLKCENLLRVGAFKFRGAYNTIAQVDRTAFPGGVVACSSGNHAQGVAAAATLLGVRSAIVMPADSPALKMSRTKAFGGEVVPYDRVREDREVIARRLCEERRAAFVHPYDDADVMAGQGTVGLEIAAQSAELGAVPDSVLVPCSGGGLVGGIAIALASRLPKAKVMSVEPDGFDDMARSLASGRHERNERLTGSICDALLMPTPGEITFAVARRLLAGGLAVSDDEARRAVRFAFEELKMVLEPGGAVALAAVLSGKIDTQGRTIAVVLSGGNVDPRLFAEIIQSG